MLVKYQGYWISGKAGLVHACSPESYVAGAIYKQGRGSSIEEVTRFALPSFKIVIASRTMLSGLLSSRNATKLQMSRVDPAGATYGRAREGYIVEIGWSFRGSLVARFGLELSRMVVDTCLLT